MLLRSLVWQRVEYCCYIGKCTRPDGIRGEVARRSQLKFHCFRCGCASGYQAQLRIKFPSIFTGSRGGWYTSVRLTKKLQPAK